VSVELRLLSDADYGEEMEIVAAALIDDYLENRLSEDERMRLEEHLHSL
jgi:hypothetical protein